MSGSLLHHGQVHGIPQATILEWVATGITPRSPTLQADSLPSEPQVKSKDIGMGSLSLLQWIFPTQELSSALQVGSLPTNLSGKARI